MRRQPGWRPALRIAARDALRSRARSILVLVMIALPVLGVSTAAIVSATAEVTGAEWTERIMGSADARVWSEGRGRWVQAPDTEHDGYSPLGDFDTERAPTEAELRAVIGDDARLLPITSISGRARVGDRAVHLEIVATDLADPMTEGLFELDSGRLPVGPDEVVVNSAMVAKGLGTGDRLEGVGTSPVIVGVGRHADSRDFPVAVGSAEALLAGDTRELNGRHVDWLVESGPVGWDQVLELNQVGFLVASRAVLADPPDLSSMAAQLGYDTGENGMIAVLALIVVMALIEVVLLAGPAFAVNARRHSRTLALIAASGGSPAQARRVILASGLVLGAVAAALGLVLGIALAIGVLPLLQRFSGQWFGPFELPWIQLVAIAAFGVLSAFLAAVVPAWLASRQDVVAVLAGRRGDRRPRATTPVLGVVLLGGGIAAASYGAVAGDSEASAIWISAAAIASVLGMVLVVPVVVSLVARATGRLPLTVRYAARDAARHRTRTVPAVAAVAATVAGVVALGIAVSSDELRNEEAYLPQLAAGDGRISHWVEALPGEDVADAEASWQRIIEAARRAAPDVEVRPVLGVGESSGGGYTSVLLRAPGHGDPTPSMYGGGLAAEVIVDDSAAPSGMVSEAARERVTSALRAGKAVVFTDDPIDADTVTVRTETWRDGSDRPERTPRSTVPAVYVQHDGTPPALAILPPVLADELGLVTSTAGVFLDGDLDEDTETAIEEAVVAVAPEASVYVERGYQRSDQSVVTLLILGTLGGVLMLGGTLTATFLALSDARPDLATMAAVGAAPRTRRRVAASYALVVGVVGALLGAGVGLIPGIAITRPLTSMTGYDGMPDTGPFLDVPWLLIAALVLALPLLTAGVVGLTTRSRLPLVARLE